MPVLKNPKYEAFAVLRAMGWPMAKAYVEIMGRHKDSAGAPEKRALAWERSSVLNKRKDVAARIRELQEQAAEKANWSKARMISYLESVLETPASALDPDNPIVEEIYATSEGMRMKTFSKTEAARLLSKLCGWEAPEKREISVSGSAEIDAALRKLLGK